MLPELTKSYVRQEAKFYLDDALPLHLNAQNAFHLALFNQIIEARGE